MEGLGRARGRATNKNQPPGARRPEGRGAGNGGGNGGARRDFQPAPAPVQSAWGRPASGGAPGPVPSGAGVSRGTPSGAAAAAGGGAGSASQGPRHGVPGAVAPKGGEGRATTTHRGDIEPHGGGGGDAGGNGGGNGDNGRGEVLRGAVRGKRVITDIIRTKPSEVLTKKGTSGRDIALQANYFKLLKKPTWCLYQYRVDFSPSIEIAALRNRLIREQKETLQGFLFDGTVLFLTIKLPNEVTEFMSKDREENPIQILVKFVGTVSMNTAASLQVLNLVLRRCMGTLDLQLVGRNFFDAAAKIDIREYNLQLWPGYVTSIRQHEQDILLCAEITNKVMRTETVYDVMKRVRNNDRNFKVGFQNAVLGMTVLTDYNNKTYRIDDVDFDKTASSTFETKEGAVSFIQYYLQKYGIKIKDPNQPLLLSKVKAKDMRRNPNQSDTIALVPELCRTTGLTEEMTSNFHLMTAVSKYTRLGPGDRIRKLLDFNHRLSSKKESVDIMADWNLKLDTHLVELPGRTLTMENIVFGKNARVAPDNEADWTKAFRNVTMFSSVELKRWYLIYPERCKQPAVEFLQLIQQASRGMNFIVSNPKQVCMVDDRHHTYASNIDSCVNLDPQMLMLVVPTQKADLYSGIKKKCCVERPVPTQVMCLRTLTPKNPRGLLSVATKVAIQMNCKLGGAPWMVDIPVSGLMTIGFDVCHDTHDKRKSYGAMVATMDMKQSCKYYSAVSAHTNGEELSNEFSLNVSKALRQFRDDHKVLPAKILVYRDGVGEGQTDYVFQHEIQVLMKTLDKIYKDASQQYRMAFIIVSKRINTRFFNKNVNPPPGTVVDDVVTLPERYDFFLVSQSCRVGTVSPTSYNVIHDNMGLPPDKLQILTYKMTHLYYNWSGTLRVPAVCQYAHKLAFLVGQFIHQSPSNLLEKQLYFL